MILPPLQKLPKSVGDLGKFIVAKGFKKLPKVQKIANSGHTGCDRDKKRETEGKEKESFELTKFSSQNLFATILKGGGQCLMRFDHL